MTLSFTPTGFEDEVNFISDYYQTDPDQVLILSDEGAKWQKKIRIRNYKLRINRYILLIYKYLHINRKTYIKKQSNIYPTKDYQGS